MELTKEQYLEKKKEIANNWFINNKSDFKNMKILSLRNYYIEEFGFENTPQEDSFYKTDEIKSYLTEKVYWYNDIVDKYPSNRIFISPIYQLLNKENEKEIFKLMSQKGFFSRYNFLKNTVTHESKFLYLLFKYDLISQSDYNQYANCISHMILIMIKNNLLDDKRTLYKFQQDHPKEFSSIISKLNNKQKEDILAYLL